MACLDTTHYVAWFNVETVHEHLLEFVLNDAEQRNGKEHGHYSGELSKALRQAFESSDSVWHVEEQGYGYISHAIAADSWPQLNEALSICEGVVIAWAQKYNVEGMKA